MGLPYARATISTRAATVLRTSAPCLYLKNDVAHGLSIGGMQMQIHAIVI